MPRWALGSLTYLEQEYAIDVDVNDSALMRDELAFQVIAKQRPVPVPGQVAQDWQEVLGLSMKIDFNSRQFVVSLPNGDELGRFTIPEGNLGDFIPEGFEFREAWDRFRELMPPLDQALEAAINALPVPDPVVGCLLRAGISTLTGQAIRCINEVRRGEAPMTLPRRVGAVFRCLGRNVPSMASTATWRAIRCVAGGGLPDFFV
jgi:hypothetical protein